MRRDDMVGTEFDWVAADSMGRIGLFSTSGYGPIPNAVLDQRDQHIAMVETIEDLSMIPDWADLLTYAGNIPVFVYNWTQHSGPYQLAQSPLGGNPLTIGDLPEQFRGLVFHLPISFDSTSTVDGNSIETQEGEQAVHGNIH
jgi:hypothetical protein